MNVTEALKYIHSVSWMGSVPGLDRTRALLARMGNPEKKLKFVHIAGTNGKGSTAAMLASVLHAAGYGNRAAQRNVKLRQFFACQLGGGIY